jgi:Carboxypeptidase regulatory-like domain
MKAALLAIVVSVCLLSANAAAGTISGTVTQTGTATPLPSMTVAAYDAAGALQSSVNSDGQGHYTLTLPEGMYRVLAYDPAGVYATTFYENAESFDTSRPIALQETQSVSAVDFALARGGFIAGVVSVGSSPMAGITVAVYNLSGTLRGLTKTNGNGVFQLVLPPGSYKVAAYDDARVYATTFHSESASFALATPVGVSAGSTATVDFHLLAGARIRGRATDAISGVALGGIVVTAYDAAGFVTGTATTTAAGNYELFLPAGSYRIVFEDRTGTYASVYYADAESFETATAIGVAAGTSTGNVDAAMQRGARLTGSVRDAVSGAPLAAIVVAAYNAGGTVRTLTTTAANGQYTLVVPPGSYKVGAYDTSVVYAPQFHAGQTAFAYGLTTNVAAGAFAGGIDFTLRRGGHVSGPVTDRATGASLAGVTVGAYDLSGTLVTSVRTAADGTYRLVVAPGIYKLVAFDEAFRYANAYLDGAASFEASRTVSIAADEESSGADFLMAAGAKASGSATDLTSGAPAAGIVVTAYDSTGTATASSTTSAAGNFAFTVPPGTYRFVAADPLHRYATSYYQNASAFNDAVQITVTAGGNATAIAFRLTRAPAPSRRRAARH